MAPGSAPPTILVVDDEAAIHGFLTAFLQEKGYRVKGAATADGAISYLRQAPVDAVVLDVKMPGRSGLDVLQHVRLEPGLRDLPVLIFTGAAMTPDEEATIAAHQAYVFYKQETLEEFGVYIDRLTTRSPSGDSPRS